MSQDFKKVLVLDERLMATNELEFGVKKSAQNITPQQYQAISESSSAHTYNLQINSEGTVIDRRVLWNSTCRLKFTTPAGADYAVPDGVSPVEYGYTDSLAPFPLHQLCSTIQATLNNNTCSINIRDVISALSRMADKQSLMRLNGSCPNMYDTYGRYTDCIGAINNPLGSYGNIGDNDLHPRGSFAVNSIYGGTPNNKQPLPIGDGVSALTFYVEFTSTEPLMLSPFIYYFPEVGNMGFYGLTNMNFTMNMGDTNRVWRSSNPWFSPKTIGNTTIAGTTITIDSFSNSRLILQQLTPSPSQLLPSRNVVPFYTMPRFITQYKSTIAPAYTQDPLTGVYNLSATTQGTIIQSTNLQLNMIPDKAIIYLRKNLSRQTPNDTDSFLAIRSISIQFNNQAGILSTATPYTLWEMSCKGGSNQSFDEFYGVASRAGGQLIPTTGSLLVLDFGSAIQINDDVYAPNSLGNFQFNFSVQVVNQFNDNWDDWELVFVPVLSGLFVSQQGTCSSYQGVLTRNDVLQVSTEEPVSASEVKRMVGGGFLDSLASVSGKVAKNIKPIAGLAKLGLSMVPHPGAQLAAKGLSAVGLGRSGGGSTGGRRHSNLEDKLM